MAQYTLPPRNPGDTSDENFDWTNFLRKGEQILTANVTCTPAGLTMNSPVIAGRLVTVEVSGGANTANGTTYTLTCTITTTSNNTFARSANTLVIPL